MFRKLACLTLLVLSIGVIIYAGIAATARPREYGTHFYFTLRVAVCTWGIFMAAFAQWRSQMPVALLFLGVAALFNPIRPFYLSKGTWSVIDLAVSLLAAWSSYAAWKVFRSADPEKALS